MKRCCGTCKHWDLTRAELSENGDGRWLAPCRMWGDEEPVRGARDVCAAEWRAPLHFEVYAFVDDGTFSVAQAWALWGEREDHPRGFIETATVQEPRTWRARRYGGHDLCCGMTIQAAASALLEAVRA